MVRTRPGSPHAHKVTHGLASGQFNHAPGQLENFISVAFFSKRCIFRAHAMSVVARSCDRIHSFGSTPDLLGSARTHNKNIFTTTKILEQHDIFPGSSQVEISFVSLLCKVYGSPGWVGGGDNPGHHCDRRTRGHGRDCDARGALHPGPDT